MKKGVLFYNYNQCQKLMLNKLRKKISNILFERRSNKRFTQTIALLPINFFE